MEAIKEVCKAYDKMLQDFEKEVQVCFWEKYDENHSVVRVATTWSTSDEDLTNLGKMLLKYAKKS